MAGRTTQEPVALAVRDVHPVVHHIVGVRLIEQGTHWWQVKVAKYTAPSFCRSLRVDMDYKVVPVPSRPQGPLRETAAEVGGRPCAGLIDYFRSIGLLDRMNGDVLVRFHYRHS